uniref:Uncharacterized protein n=1 Tax=Chromera velia CCMP2878 TaxID=1169474 RepID=A0A0G4FI40_9ALVE|eukprot:Cvel_16980.t1-p1 / transcript=Cvel_16980.t1 / gene=Cvel_16980 / organism=Chromera_velia_CCMP2878 / gene_product=hypothetical protein / transcript_product=hypothetical protein / location=Cvel_scaffold1333:35410-44500(-) / protein_length=1036 / sequence_SO=supercontig / SO=protein_coding / is_pseudo=false
MSFQADGSAFSGAEGEGVPNSLTQAFGFGRTRPMQPPNGSDVVDNASRYTRTPSVQTGGAESTTRERKGFRNSTETENFRESEILFLQRQNQQVLRALEEAERERDDAVGITDDLKRALEDRQAEAEEAQDRARHLEKSTKQTMSDFAAKEDHIRMLSEQNRQLLRLLEEEESRHKRTAEQGKLAAEAGANLEKERREAEIMRQREEAAALSLRQELLQEKESGKKSATEVDSLRTTVANLEAQAQVDIEAMDQALQVSKKKNAELLARQQSLESQLRRQQEEANRQQQQIHRLEGHREELEAKLQGEALSSSSRDSDILMLKRRAEQGEKQCETLKQALLAAENVTGSLQEETRQNAEKFREMSDKAYSLMDTVRLSQLELKRHETELLSRGKRITQLEAQVSSIQSTIAGEVEVRQAADAAAREAERGKAAAVKRQLVAEEDLRRRQVQIGVLEEQMMKVNDQMKNLRTEEELSSELAYIRREDLLDENGRMRPLVIEAANSDLTDRLKINDFLARAQQHRNPVPMMVEKIAQLLEMIHDSQEAAETYMQDLAKANQVGSSMRVRNLSLFEKLQRAEEFQTRVHRQLLVNLFEAGLHKELPLSGLELSKKDLEELGKLAAEHSCSDNVVSIDLRNNGLTDEDAPRICMLLENFAYLKSLKVSQNHLTGGGIRQIEERVRAIPGVTFAQLKADPPMRIEAHSGNQHRLTVEVHLQTRAPPQEERGSVELSWEAAPLFASAGDRHDAAAFSEPHAPEDAEDTEDAMQFQVSRGPPPQKRIRPRPPKQQRQTDPPGPSFGKPEEDEEGEEAAALMYQPTYSCRSSPGRTRSPPRVVEKGSRSQASGIGAVMATFDPLSEVEADSGQPRSVGGRQVRKTAGAATKGGKRSPYRSQRMFPQQKGWKMTTTQSGPGGGHGRSGGGGQGASNAWGGKGGNPKKTTGYGRATEAESRPTNFPETSVAFSYKKAPPLRFQGGSVLQNAGASLANGGTKKKARPRDTAALEAGEPESPVEKVETVAEVAGGLRDLFKKSSAPGE